MVKEYYRRICAGDQLRQNLIALRDELKDEKSRREFAYLLGGDFSKLCGLLENEDPKVRRNAAVIMGKMESEDLLPVLFDTYKNEKTLFVRADYLKVMRGMDYRPVLGALRERLAWLRQAEPAPEERKHIQAEIRALQEMVSRFEKKEPHRFIGWHDPLELVLVTNRCQREVTARQVSTGEITMLAGGLRIKGAQVAELCGLRTYREMLFPIKTGSVLAAQIGEALVEPVLELVQGLHQGDGAYPFRIELKSRIEQKRRGVLLREISDAVERVSGGALINSVSDYELEIRLLERRDGSFLPMVKLFTIPDKRFAYRREVVASSIAPVNAALVAELARPYLKEGAQVLDPFCGVGTMLIERDRAVRAGVMYGVDIFGEAIEKAKRNTERAGCKVYYINKDFFAFEHGYRFDEIITDLPQVTENHSLQEMRGLYRDFFAAAGRYLQPEAVLVVHTTEPKLVQEALRGRGEYRIMEKHTVNEKNGTEVLIIRRDADA